MTVPVTQGSVIHTSAIAACFQAINTPATRRVVGLRLPRLRRSRTNLMFLFTVIVRFVNIVQLEERYDYGLSK